MGDLFPCVQMNGVTISCVRAAWEKEACQQINKPLLGPHNMTVRICCAFEKKFYQNKHCMLLWGCNFSVQNCASYWFDQVPFLNASPTTNVAYHINGGDILLFLKPWHSGTVDHIGMDYSLLKFQCASWNRFRKIIKTER